MEIWIIYEYIFACNEKTSLFVYREPFWFPSFCFLIKYHRNWQGDNLQPVLNLL